MIHLGFAIFLFAWVHPGSKLILDSGLPFATFCTLYLVIRALVQLPLVVAGKARLKRSQMTTLLGLGFAGAMLQITEFKGISDQIPVPIVTFLLYAHPLWIGLFGRWISGDEVSGLGKLKIGIGIVGVGLITGASLTKIENPWLLLAPISASLFLALWIMLSRRAAQKGVTPLSLSFWFDSFSSVYLLVLLGDDLTHDFPTAALWLSDPTNLGAMIAYSIFVGLLPNLLFFLAVREVQASKASAVLLSEPILASILAWILWQDPLSSTFVLGAVCVLLANFPDRWLHMFVPSVYKAVRSS